MPTLKKVLAWAMVGVAVSATAPARVIGKRPATRSSSASASPQQGLWREAIYRWERAVELDPTYAAAFNNLAIAYETAGEFEKAKQAYEKAIELDPKNVYIKQNFDLFKEINDRANRQTPR